MKPLRLAVLSLTAVSLLASVSSCSSDRNPFDSMQLSTEKPTAKIRLNLDVAATRADDPLSTPEEKAVTKVWVYVFDEKNTLEAFNKDAFTVSEGTSVELSVSSAGRKTVYAIASQNVAASATNGMTMETFEKIVFNSEIANLKTTKELVMVGKSEPKQVYASVSATDIPASNMFDIELVRVLAKTQVKVGSINTSDFGFTYGGANFKVFQTCDKMRLKSNGTDVIPSFINHNKGTYEGYSLPSEEEMMEMVLPAPFTADNCRYMSENIVSNTTTGNTTFVSFNISLIPEFIYTYSGTLSRSNNTSSYAGTFYAVALLDATHGVEDFAIDTQDGKKRVITFNNSNQAKQYADAINGGTASPMTVSEADAPMRASMTVPSTRAVRNFEVVEFSGGNVYYRINIKDGEDYKVLRNKYYKITVNSIKSLGCHSEEMLRPTDPNTPLTLSTSSAMVSAKFHVAAWDDTDQSVDLD